MLPFTLYSSKSFIQSNIVKLDFKRTRLVSIYLLVSHYLRIGQMYRIYSTIVFLWIPLYYKLVGYFHEIKTIVELNSKLHNHCIYIRFLGIFKKKQNSKTYRNLNFKICIITWVLSHYEQSIKTRLIYFDKNIRTSDL